MSKIYITRQLPSIAEEMLKGAGHEVTTNPSDRVLSKEELIAELRTGQYDAVLSLLTDSVDSEVLSAAGPVKIFSNYAVGFNNIDIEAAKERNIIVTNTPGVLSDSVAEHTMALIMSLAKRIVEADRFTREGKYEGWAPMLFLGDDLKGSTLGLIGAGRIGSLVAKSAINGFGMDVIYYDIARNSEADSVGAKYFENISDVLQSSDYVSVHVPLLDSTKHLINSDRLHEMRKTAYLINTSRGPVVDENALVKALKEGVIKGAALDVFENEPSLAPGLAELSNVILTPHTASATEKTRGKMAEMAAKAIIDVLSGNEPDHRVA